MPTISTRVITITHAGDVDGVQTIEALPNPASPAAISILTLEDTDNMIMVPTSSNIKARAVTIKPPAGNTVAIFLKGVDTDAGIALHPEDPSTISLSPNVTEFYLTATDPIDRVRLFWS